MDKIDEVLTRGVANIIPNKEGLRKLLGSGKKLNIYTGFDVTAPRLTLGHTVPFRMLQTLSEMGHNVTFLIGDFTSTIGDTSDKESERPAISPEQIKKDLKTYQAQASKIIDFSKVKTKFNSSWLSKLTFKEVLELSQHFSLGDFTSRELIKRRMDQGKRVGLHEVLYPVMQGYDHYFMDTDLQIGSTDQTFNMQAGRTLQKDLRNKESFVMTHDILEGTDGRKMSKSWGNAIWIEDEPSHMYGKVMSLRDDLIEQYFTLATWTPIDEIAKIIKGNVLAAKKKLAFTIVSELHSTQDAKEAQKHFERTFQKGEPEYKKEIERVSTAAGAVELAASVSHSEAKRLIRQGAVDINDKTITDPALKISVHDKIKVGKKIFVKVK
ncbi:tyrosine--tRNA ligase [Candidatus Woesebacteria bacterium RIFCSPHIGHO2_01_FULL_44_10]|uniref:Tyrosine--tRNA ligase n=1 Tax=Candidatus Woesebacteria bacterium RIFCSPLOWO2_01_FULL_44_14 TaxID=1802525 RepID=A0A1F8BXN2_9BACT|nr:MAG: tyrosine--tRNA ligase [Candidatus Woesebacteria bacterium RIFCSPHIGHO2_01_FULL_44_10]OGM56426.1 MAG: tyrosine--tRNA ligase [Candidatus Woesebacteria bacterium RIFCSPHIGHO2_12_FULL_44_11]OGM68827.1 MAG: tyrosine--tRNA ligase [Candidatus Woesebacteria bacterium RIFCSPLOWO2_01_FULL_44_14]